MSNTLINNISLYKMTTTYNQLVDSVVAEFQQVFVEDANLSDQFRAVMLNRENDFRMFFTMKGGSVPGANKKNSRKNPKKMADPNKPNKTNWQAIWTSKEYGCSSYPPFADKIKEIRDNALAKCEDNKKPNQFKLNNELQQFAKSGDGSLYRGWMEQATVKLVADGKPLPSGPKSDTQRVKGSKKPKPDNDDNVLVQEGGSPLTKSPPKPAPKPAQLVPPTQPQTTTPPPQTPPPKKGRNPPPKRS